MKKIAFVYTEYQQNILFAICLQEEIVLDVIFVRKNIILHHDIHTFAKKVVIFDDIPYSWRFFTKYYCEFKQMILPEINANKSYLILTWSVENPLVRILLNKLSSKKVYLFEDGAGSYMHRGLFQLGIKHYLATSLISSVIDIISLKIKPYDYKQFIGWSLYDNCFPDLDIERNLIEHPNFQKAMNGFTQKNNIINFSKNSIVFIQQPYIEMTILNEEEYIRIHTESVMKIKKYVSVENFKIIWKLHPRTDIEHEYRRIAMIKKHTNVELEILEERWNMEHVALLNKDNEIQYFSLGSSALYVISALIPKSTFVFLIENETLKQKLSTQVQVNNFYKSIGVKLI